ncbi:phosphate ABC transporter substrate-binding protein PstS [Streptomyces sp. CMB-StM0423]|uniref:phosphate ABC transporter substrate-binding protein PstS n=1 Tax=Streptomyces sp. CMB-StM0423 TaxID=2059884 RepID=UPI000C707719|nr:phosphate ABC transporter substrate-binding protein PstS [Streptomyces sp. CMB-StM0423]AUH41797.1 phosphate ABC transporter substrate-binding protein PstS [Streptomyces sp. CMB-StM0423]
MKSQSKIRYRTAAGILALSSALVLSACGSDDNSDSGDDKAKGGDKSSAAAGGEIKCGGSGELLASGASSQDNAVQQWVADYQAACPDVTVNYKPVGSGAGIEEFLNGQTAFAGSDSALEPEEVEKSKEVCSGGQGINLPMVGGPVAIAYHLEGVDELVLDAETLANVFNGEIKQWNDDAIAKLNPDAKLPDTKIQPVHRSDESGTTENFTAYLNTVVKDAWPDEADKKWPIEGGQAATGSAGVSSQVKQTDGAISYMEISHAESNELSTVKLDTGAAEPVEATVENASQAIAVGKRVGQAPDMALELDYATKEDGAYPITLVTYEIACDKGNKQESLDAVKSFLAYTASEAGQQSIVDVGYAPLPADMAAEVAKTVDTLS